MTLDYHNNGARRRPKRRASNAQLLGLLYRRLGQLSSTMGCVAGIVNQLHERGEKVPFDLPLKKALQHETEFRRARRAILLRGDEQRERELDLRSRARSDDDVPRRRARNGNGREFHGYRVATAADIRRVRARARNYQRSTA
jgi:hypothetical protein